MSRARRRFTLIEVVIVTAILGILILVVGSALLVLKDAAVESNIGISQEDTARKVLAEVRRELRTSGFKQDGTAQFVIKSAGAAVADGTPGDSIEFRKRLGAGTANDDPAGWSTLITFRRVAAAEPFSGIQAPVPTRYDLVAVRGGLTVVMAKNLSNLAFTRVISDGTILVRLELTQNNPKWSGATPPQAFTRVYTDQIQMLNQRP